jgi:hypothetical protein
MKSEGGRMKEKLFVLHSHTLILHPSYFILPTCFYGYDKDTRSSQGCEEESAEEFAEA